MAKKTYNTDSEREHFNKTPYGDSKKLRKLLIKSLNKVADKYDATPISLRKKNNEFTHWEHRESFWHADCFREYLNYVEQTHNKWPERDWLDTLIRQCGHMVWNLVYKTFMKEFRENEGYWTLKLLSETLPKKQRGNESVADHFANKEVEEFFSKFK